MCIFCVLPSNTLTYIESECKQLVKNYILCEKTCQEMSFCPASADSPGESFMPPSNQFLKCVLVYQLQRLCPCCARNTRITYLKQDNMSLSSSSATTNQGSAASALDWKCHCASEQNPTCCLGNMRTGSLSACMFRSIDSSLSLFLGMPNKYTVNICKYHKYLEYHNQHRKMLDLWTAA